jgi:antitoxin component of MazEF toxin-antitoxin module
VLFLVKPSGVTKAADLARAPNGSFVTGDPNDVLALQVQKSQDLSVAMQGKQQIEARLSQAFMLADVRDSERTTAEEVRLQALQIENSLGSIYSILTTEFQVPYVSRKLDILTRAGKVPKLPKDLVKPVMTVGLAAVGRGNDLEQLVRFTTTLGQTMGPESLSTYIKPSELIKRLAYSMGIDVLGLVKTEEELAAEAQQQQQMAQQQQLMASPMGDPQKLATAAATVQEMQAGPEQQPTDQQPA